MLLKSQSLAGRSLLCALLLLSPASAGRAVPQKTSKALPLERDHVFVWVSPGAPEAAALRKLGLHTDGQVHKHVGQGTSSVVFLFENAYLELIWVDEPETARRKNEEMGTNMIARSDWRRTGASPFGVGLRRLPGAGDLPFPTKKYWAEWMKPDTFISIAESSAELKEPFYFVVPEYMAMPSGEQLRALLAAQPDFRKNLTHALGVRTLTAVRITTDRAGRFSSTAGALSEGGVVVLKRGRTHRAELTFDGGARGKTLDVRPTLPLVLKY